jgi:hypothetical protein
MALEMEPKLSALFGHPAEETVLIPGTQVRKLGGISVGRGVLLPVPVE